MSIALIAQSAQAAPNANCRPEPEPLLIELTKFHALDLEAAKQSYREAVTDIKLFQEGLKVYRDCLERQGQELQEKAAKKGEPVDRLQIDRLQRLWNASVDKEEQIIGEYDGLRRSLCSRGEQAFCD